MAGGSPFPMVTLVGAQVKYVCRFCATHLDLDRSLGAPPSPRGFAIGSPLGSRCDTVCRIFPEGQDLASVEEVHLLAGPRRSYYLYMEYLLLILLPVAIFLLLLIPLLFVPQSQEFLLVLLGACLLGDEDGWGGAREGELLGNGRSLLAPSLLVLVPPGVGWISPRLFVPFVSCV